LDIVLDQQADIALAGRTHSADTSNRARTPGRLSTASGDSGHIGGYAAFSPGRVHFDVGGDYGFGSVTVNRLIPQLGLGAGGNQDQETGQVFADLGYRIRLDGVALEPYAGIAHIVASGGSFAETGSVAALSGSEKSDSSTYSLLGLRTELADMALGAGMTLSPRLDLGWQHALAPFTPYQTVSFASTGTSFQVLGSPLVEDAGVVQAGFELKAGGAATLFVSYDGSFSSTVESQGFHGGLNWRF
jgi:outer membrane autotransporter protein